MFTKVRQVNYAGLKKITTQEEKLRMISNIEATVSLKMLRVIVSKYLEAIGAKRKKDSFVLWKRIFRMQLCFSSKMQALMSFNGRAEIYENNNIVGDWI